MENDESGPLQAIKSVLDLTSPGKLTVTGEMKNDESNSLDSTFQIANFISENALSFHFAATQTLAAVVLKCIEFS